MNSKVNRNIKKNVNVLLQLISYISIKKGGTYTLVSHLSNLYLIQIATFIKKITIGILIDPLHSDIKRKIFTLTTLHLCNSEYTVQFVFN